MTATEVMIRKADADWTAAMDTASRDDWMSFYAPDAIVYLPGDHLASGQVLVQSAVTRVLALPHRSITWNPTEVNAARGGDVATVIGSYELQFDDARGTPAVRRGRRLEVWRKQGAGIWKCIVDTWNLDELPADPITAPPLDVQRAPPSAASAAPPAPMESPRLSAPLEVGPPAPPREVATPYGDMPAEYRDAIRKYFLEHLKHPESIQYREMTKPEQGYITEMTGGFLLREKREYGWTVRAVISAKDSHNNYTEFKTYTFLFRGEKIVDARLPLPGDEMN
jgi:ketosteroid isomerase-like protein